MVTRWRATSTGPPSPTWTTTTSSAWARTHSVCPARVRHRVLPGLELDHRGGLPDRASLAERQRERVGWQGVQPRLGVGSAAGSRGCGSGRGVGLGVRMRGSLLADLVALAAEPLRQPSSRQAWRPRAWGVAPVPDRVSITLIRIFACLLKTRASVHVQNRLSLGVSVHRGGEQSATRR